MEFKELNLRKSIQISIYYLIPILLLIVSILNSNSDFYKDLGNPAIYTLMLVMFIKPISVIFEQINIFRTILSYRRELGILSFWFFFFHASGIIYTQQILKLEYYYFSFENLLFWGLISALTMIILAITSNMFSVRLLKNNWKKVQRISYIAFIAALLHVGFANNKEELPLYIGIIILYIILKIIQIYIEKKRLKERNESNLNTL